MSNGLLRKQAMSIEIIGTGSRTKTRNLRDHVGQCDEDPDIDDDRQPTDNQIQQKLNGSAVPDLELGVAEENCVHGRAVHLDLGAAYEAAAGEGQRHRLAPLVDIRHAEAGELGRGISHLLREVRAAADEIGIAAVDYVDRMIAQGRTDD